MGLLPYHIEQYIEVEYHRVLVSVNLLEQFMEWRNQEFEKEIDYFKKENLKSVVHYLQKKKEAGGLLYTEIRNLLRAALDDCERLIKTIRSDRDWDMKLWDDKNFREDFKRTAAWAEKFLRMVNERVEKLLSLELLPVTDENRIPPRISIIMANIPFGFKDAQGFLKDILNYVEDVERRMGEKEQPTPTNPVKRAISAIRSLVRRVFSSTEERASDEEEASESNETAPG
jgi:hypothetical protein